MEAVTGQIVGVLYSSPFIFLLIGASIYFSLAMKFPQFRLFKNISQLLREKDSSDSGFSPFQSLMVTVGGRVGVGNIAGVATAIALGGPGAIFWMWLMALLAASMAVAESSLAQVYKIEINGEFIGGPPIYIARALRQKWLSVLFSILSIGGCVVAGTAMQAGMISNSVNSNYGIPNIVTGLIVAAVTGFVVFGGFRRIGKAASILSPIMAIIYLLVAVIIMILNITKLPGVLGLIFSSAFSTNAVFGGLAGTAFSYGLQRGLFSNEAGMGTGAMISGSVVSTHPAKQGLIQALSVFIDTIVVCTASAFLILITNSYNVYDASGNAVVEYLPNVGYGVDYVIQAVNKSFPGFGAPFICFSITLFSLTCLFSFYMVSESSVKFNLPNNKWVILVLRIAFMAGIIAGSTFSVQAIFNLADIANALDAWINIIVILILSPKVIKLMKDYDEQRKAGKDPTFSAKKTLGLDDTVWDK